MDFEKQWKTEIEKRKARFELETCTNIESLREFALALFDQNEAYKQLALTVMKNNLIGE